LWYVIEGYNIEFLVRDTAGFMWTIYLRLAFTDVNIQGHWFSFPDTPTDPNPPLDSFSFTPKVKVT